MYQVAVSRGLSRLKISDGMKCDLRWWADYAPYFNGVSLIPFIHYPDSIWTDSSQKGFGAALTTDWLAGDWCCALNDNELSTRCSHFVKPPVLGDENATNINELELYVVVSAMERWAPALKNYSVTLKCDNLQVVHMLINQASINSQCMDWLRRLFWLTMRFNVRICPSYIYVPTDENVLGVTLSRLLYFKSIQKLSALLLPFGLCCHDASITDMGEHFCTPPHQGLDDVRLHVLDFIHCYPQSPTAEKLRDQIEARWIHRLRCLAPLGLNMKDTPKYRTSRN